ncbi:NAD(P)/FAD-dependent oxidoreductase [Pseudooceanicola sp. LIPI14-2-Ac024]|uniref:NAD(P)/FAD-dependent oxidoreductase n=1 Tax=Pseudooceanicola sp. LIPI14-2-Ac024 TaxID=3344875 RepID=UPI0035CFEFDB
MTAKGNLWRDSAGESISTVPLSGDVTADLCVIGGGFTGCSAALRAAGAGASVVLIEAETVGHGGSGRNVGLVNAGLWTPPEEITQLLPDQAAGFIARLGEAPAEVFRLIERHQIDCEPVRNGTLHLAHAEAGMADLRNRHRQQAALGAPVRLLDAAETRARTGTDGFHGALLDMRAGTVQPLGYARGLARAAIGAGARLHEMTPATAVRHEGGTWHVTTPGGTIRAGALILATNAYHRPFDGPGVPPVVIPSFFQAATAPLPEATLEAILPGGEGCWDTGLVMTSVRRDRAGRLILGAFGSMEAAGRGVHLAWARRKLAALYPALAGQAFTHAWSGRIAMTGDHLPKILRLGPRGLAAFGYSGRGIAPGTVFGAALAEALVSGSEDGLPLRPVDGHRDGFAGLRGAWIETGATLVHATGARF